MEIGNIFKTNIRLYRLQIFVLSNLSENNRTFEFLFLSPFKIQCVAKKRFWKSSFKKTIRWWWNHNKLLLSPVRHYVIFFTIILWISRYWSTHCSVVLIDSLYTMVYTRFDQFQPPPFPSTLPPTARYKLILKFPFLLHSPAM